MALKGFRRNVFGNSACYICANCKHNTRNVGGDEAGLDLCELCYDEAGRENAHSDGHHADEKDMDCHECNPAIKTVIQQRAEATKRASSPAVNTPKGKETTMSNATKAQAEVAKLVKKLSALKDKSDSEGRKIRRILRKLGHRGGTRTTKASKAPAKARKPARKLVPTAKAAREALAAE